MALAFIMPFPPSPLVTSLVSATTRSPVVSIIIGFVAVHFISQGLIVSEEVPFLNIIVVPTPVSRDIFVFPYIVSGLRYN